MSLSKQEEYRLIALAQLGMQGIQGVQEAIDQLVKAHESRIRDLAVKHQSAGIVGGDDLYSENNPYNKNDLYNAGVLGFLEAIKNFNEDRGGYLWSYARL